MPSLIEHAIELEKQLKNLGFNSTLKDCLFGLVYVEGQKIIKQNQTPDLLRNQRLQSLLNKAKTEMKPLPIATLPKHVQQVKSKPVRLGLANLDMTGEEEKEPTEELLKIWQQRESQKRPWEK